MKKILLIIFICNGIFERATAQQKQQLTDASVIKDTTGREIPYVTWNKLLMTGRYKIKAETPENKNTAFFIIPLSDEEYEKKLTSLPKPPESKFFKTGTAFSHFKTKDIDGNKINTKNLTGKTIVLNFWFISCPPCQAEMPELNHLAESYKSDTSVVFIAVALDQESEIKEFLRTHPFGYKIIDDGRFITSQYQLTSYPTNVIIDPEGKVYFHSSGLAMNTVYWLKKSIEELKKFFEKKKEPAS